MAGRVQLVRSVIQGMLIHSISVYSWPVCLIKDLERWMRNFIWSGDVSQRKLVTVSWKKVCSSFKEGGLNIRSLSILNQASNLKLCWELSQSNLQWAQFLRSRVIRGTTPISYHIFSSIWSSIKHKFLEVNLNSSWQVGNGEFINFWLDSWCGDPLTQALDIPHHLHHSLKANVKCFIENSQWKIPSCLLHAYPTLKFLIEKITIPLIDKEDKLLWTFSHDGDLSLKDAFSFHCTGGQNIGWAKIIWNTSIPPSKSMIIWRCLHLKMPTDENLSMRGCNLPSMCSLCGNNVESAKHLFLDCIFSQNIWNWLASIVQVNCHFLEFDDVFSICSTS
jgi:hypothetical protein